MGFLLEQCAFHFSVSCITVPQKPFHDQSSGGEDKEQCLEESEGLTEAPPRDCSW